MVIDTKIMRFMKAAKVICSKNTVNKITGIAYNNQMIVATNCNAQLTYTSDEYRKDTIYLPVKAIDYIMSFGKGSKIDFRLLSALTISAPSSNKDVLNIRDKVSLCKFISIF